MKKSNSEWKKELTQEQYYILREKGTEKPFTGKLLHIKDEGVFVCAACKTPLFSSNSKYDSGSGWPSFYQPIQPEVILTQEDTSHEMIRTEVACKSCHSHLGHLFPDGPKPTGMRYCINSLSLDFHHKISPEL